MRYLTLGFAIASFLAAGVIALAAPAHSGLAVRAEITSNQSGERAALR